jgi:DnaJ-domain-containing protein 1
MTDYFALLKESRRPWLDADALKTKFHTLSAEVHPDRVHQASAEDKEVAQQRYIELNAAYQCLRDPRQRLRHLLELELGAKPSDLTNVPDDLMELFFSVGRTFRDVDALLAEKGRATSPLLQVQVFERGQEWMEKLNAVREQIVTRRDRLLAELQTVDVSWAAAAAKPTDTLLRIWRLLSFYDRWLAQIHERVVQLSF